MRANASVTSCTPTSADAKQAREHHSQKEMRTVLLFTPDLLLLIDSEALLPIGAFAILYKLLARGKEDELPEETDSADEWVDAMNS